MLSIVSLAVLAAGPVLPDPVPAAIYRHVPDRIQYAQETLANRPRVLLAERPFPKALKPYLDAKLAVPAPKMTGHPDRRQRRQQGQGPTPDPTPSLPPQLISGCGDHSSLASEVPTTSQGSFNMYTCVCDPGTFCRESLPGREHLPCEVLDGSEEVVTSHSEYTCFGLTSETCFGEVYQCMVPPTPEPTQAPVPAPTTLEPSPAPTDTGECPRNCGTAERGGGQCRPNGRCLSCNRGRLLSGGRCFQSIACKGRRIQGGGQAGSNCRCLDDHCHYCNRAVEGGDTCRVCRDSWYLLDGRCTETCPAELASSGVGQFKRRCAEPFTCRNGRIQGQDVAFGCKCATEGNTAIASCQTCEHRAGEYGQHCLRCNNGQYEFENRCRASCDDAALIDQPGVTLIHYTPGNYGRQCRPAFTCTAGVDENGVACRCSRDLRNQGYTSCHWGEDGASGL